MKKILFIFGIMAAIAVVGSCEKNEQDPTYIGESRIFLKGSSIEFSFARFPSSQTDTLISLTVQVVGDLVDYDRGFAAEIDGSSTALPDEYELVSDFIVPANSFEGKLGVKIKRAERLEEETAELKINMVPTNDFLVNETITGLSAQNITLRTSLSVSWTSLLVQPPLWYGQFGLDNFIGGYSKKKHQLIIDLTPYADFEIFTTSASYNIQKYAIQSALQQYVAQYNAEHEDRLVDENGIEVVIARQSIPRP